MVVMAVLWPGGAQAMSESEWRDIGEGTAKLIMGGFGFSFLAAFYGIYFGASVLIEYIFAKLFCEGTLKKAFLVVLMILIIGAVQGALTNFLFPSAAAARDGEEVSTIPIWFGVLGLGVAIYTNIAVRKAFYGSGAIRNLVIGFLNYLLAGVGAVLIILFLLVPSLMADAKEKRKAQMEESARQAEAANRAAQEDALLRGQIDAAYKSLTEKRKTLNAKDVKAVEAFNAEAARYQELQKRFRERQAPAGSPPASAPATQPPAATPAPVAK